MSPTYPTLTVQLTPTLSAPNLTLVGVIALISLGCLIAVRGELAFELIGFICQMAAIVVSPERPIRQHLDITISYRRRRYVWSSCRSCCKIWKWIRLRVCIDMRRLVLSESLQGRRLTPCP